MKPLADAGELTKEAAERALEQVAQKHGLSAQDTKDLELVVGAPTAIIVGAVGSKTGRVVPKSLPKLGTVDDFIAGQVKNLNSKLGKKIGELRLPFARSKQGVEQAKAAVHETLSNITDVSNVIPKSATRGNYDLIHVYSDKTVSTVSLRVLPDGSYEFDTLIPEKTNRF